MTFFCASFRRRSKEENIDPDGEPERFHRQLIDDCESDLNRAIKSELEPAQKKWKKYAKQYDEDGKRIASGERSAEEIRARMRLNVAKNHVADCQAVLDQVKPLSRLQ